ncbi:type II toxin-antitoxin system Phd/YefM family antitoxin [Mycobacterium sp.]|uniref:type II toxin-antitoxin system Phd/YefM family antitoxin n=1 Tax=Mycobacterium sp. TaxID=1785 RepID=UPI003D09D378
MMTTVSVRAFSYNPSAMFARAEKGETIEITRHGEVIATLVPGKQKERSRIEELEASGALRRSGKTASDLDTFTRFDVDTDVDPLQLLFEDRYGEREWERELKEEAARRGKGAGE